jgi:hypothetical protein
MDHFEIFRWSQLRHVKSRDQKGSSSYVLEIYSAAGGVAFTEILPLNTQHGSHPLTQIVHENCGTVYLHQLSSDRLGGAILGYEQSA